MAASVPASRNGPNGRCDFRDARPEAMRASPATAAKRYPRNRPADQRAGAEPAQVQAEEAGQLHVSPAEARRVDEHLEQEDRPGQGHAEHGGQEMAAASGQQQSGEPEQRQGHRVGRQGQRVGQPPAADVDHGQRYPDPGQVAERRERRDQPEAHRDDREGQPGAQDQGPPGPPAAGRRGWSAGPAGAGPGSGAGAGGAACGGGVPARLVRLPGRRRGGQQAGSEPAGRPSREQPGRRGDGDGDPVRRVHRLPGSSAHRLTGLSTVDALDLRDREGRGPAGYLDGRQSIRPGSVEERPHPR